MKGLNSRTNLLSSLTFCNLLNRCLWDSCIETQVCSQLCNIKSSVIVPSSSLKVKNVKSSRCKVSDIVIYLRESNISGRLIFCSPKQTHRNIDIYFWVNSMVCFWNYAVCWRNYSRNFLLLNRIQDWWFHGILRFYYWHSFS